MKIVYLALIFSVFMASATAQTSFTFKKDHDALQVKDLKKSSDFYAQILGLKEIDNAGLGTRYKWFELSDKVQIHLIENPEDIKKHKGVHLALNCDDLQAFIEHLKKKEVHFENWVAEPFTTNTRPDGVKQIYLQDPDGYWIEVNDNSL